MMVTQKISKDAFIKIAVLNDLLEAALVELNPQAIIEPVSQSKYRNLLRSCNVFTNYTGTLLTSMESKENFGELCDEIDALINNHISKEAIINQV